MWPAEIAGVPKRAQLVSSVANPCRRRPDALGGTATAAAELSLISRNDPDLPASIPDGPNMVTFGHANIFPREGAAVPRHLKSRAAPPVHPARVMGLLGGLVRHRWAYDCARWPDDYPQVQPGEVVREGDRVLVLCSAAGEVLTRYLLVREPGTRSDGDGSSFYAHHAYRALVEL